MTQKKRLKKFIIGSFSTLCLISPFLGSSDVFAATLPGEPQPSSKNITIYNNHGNALYIANHAPKPHPFLPVQATNGINNNPLNKDPYIGNSYGSTINTVNESDNIEFETDVTTTASWWNAYFNGWSQLWCTGSPDPQSMTLTDTYWTSGVGISVSYPTGVGVSGSGGTAVWSATNNSGTLNEMNHNFKNIKFSGSIVQVGQNESGTFQFGGNYYTISTSNSSWVGVG